jgi:hypothetical protein
MSTQFTSIVFFCILCYYSKYCVKSIVYVVIDSEIFDAVRGYIEVKYNKSKLEYLINCPFCLSFWASLIVGVLFFVSAMIINFDILNNVCLFIVLVLCSYGQSIQDLQNKKE